MSLDRDRQCGWCRLPIALTPYRNIHVWVHTRSGQPVCSDGTRRNCNTLAPSDPDRPVVYFADASLSDADRRDLLEVIVEAVENAVHHHADADRHDQVHWQGAGARDGQSDVADSYRLAAERETGRAAGLIQWYSRTYDSRDAHQLTARLAQVGRGQAALADIIGDLHLLDPDQEPS